MAQCLGGIDHALVGVRDLEQARTTFARLGFCTTPLGRHVGRGTGEYCLMFADDYVELCGVVDHAGDTEDLARFLATGEGLWALALRTLDPDATYAAWQASGLKPAAVAEDARTIDPDVELRSKDVLLDLTATSGVPLFACAPLDLEPLRRPSGCGTPTARGRSARSPWWSRSRRRWSRR